MKLEGNIANISYTKNDSDLDREQQTLGSVERPWS
jgi:hypothetical protein